MRRLLLWLLSIETKKKVYLNLELHSSYVEIVFLIAFHTVIENVFFYMESW